MGMASRQHEKNHETRIEKKVMITRKGRHGLFFMQKFRKGGNTAFPRKKKKRGGKRV